MAPPSASNKHKARHFQVPAGRLRLWPPLVYFFFQLGFPGGLFGHQAHINTTSTTQTYLCEQRPNNSHNVFVGLPSWFNRSSSQSSRIPSASEQVLPLEFDAHTASIDEGPTSSLCVLRQPMQPAAAQPVLRWGWGGGGAPPRTAQAVPTA